MFSKRPFLLVFLLALDPATDPAEAGCASSGEGVIFEMEILACEPARLRVEEAFAEECRVETRRLRKLLDRIGPTGKFRVGPFPTATDLKETTLDSASPRYSAWNPEFSRGNEARSSVPTR